jgi:hypothetical protein
MQFHPSGLSKSKKLGVGTECVSSKMRKSLESVEHRTDTEHVPCQEIDTNCCLAVSSYKQGDCEDLGSLLCSVCNKISDHYDDDNEVYKVFTIEAVRQL